MALSIRSEEVTAQLAQLHAEFPGWLLERPEDVWTASPARPPGVGPFQPDGAVQLSAATPDGLREVLAVHAIPVALDRLAGELQRRGKLVNVYGETLVITTVSGGVDVAINCDATTYRWVSGQPIGGVGDVIAAACQIQDRTRRPVTRWAE